MNFAAERLTTSGDYDALRLMDLTLELEPDNTWTHRMLENLDREEQ